MRMEASCSNSSRIGGGDDEERGLKSLLDAFAASFTLDEIASAYCRAGRDPDLAGEILFEMQESSSSSISSANGEAKESEVFSESSHVSAGSVSSIIGKNYARVTRPKNGICEPTKPVKLDASEFPESEIWGEDSNSNPNPNPKRNDLVHRDMEEFLFSMLGGGFKLDREVIREVLDACGYDMPKSVDKLLCLSTEGLDRKNKSVCDTSDKFMESSAKVEVPSCRGKFINQLQRNEARASNLRQELSTQQKQKKDLERELLVSMFGAEKQHTLVLPKRASNTVKRSGIFGLPVSEPLCDPIVELKANAEDLQQAEYMKENKERYEVIRTTVKNHLASMRQCYQFAVEEYMNDKPDKARKLMDQGLFFRDLARKADEESSNMILEPKAESSEIDEVVLDLHKDGSKEAIRLLKTHLSSLSGIPSKYLKVIIERNEEDTSKSNGSRRRSVVKLLEKESIKWVEEVESSGTIVIQLDCIDRRQLSFAKK